MPPPPSSPMPGYPQPVPPYGQPGFPAPKGHTGRNVALVLGSVAMVAVLIAVIHFATDKSGSSDNIAQTGSTTTQSSPSIPSASTPGFTYPQYTAPTDTDTPSPTDSPSAPDYTPPPADTPTSYFDPTSLNEKATDQTPLTQDAFLPQQFTDDKGVPFTLRAGGSKGCVQNAMSQNVQNLLHDNACTEMMTGDYLDQDNRVLVSVEVFPFVDESHAVAGYNAMQKDSRGVDFGIWCPTNGTGSAACDSNSDYHQAVYEQWSEQNHRYVIAALAVYVNMSNDSTVKPWLQSAAKKAVDAVGPQNYSGNQ
jgi:hypothetical protein